MGMFDGKVGVLERRFVRGGESSDRRHYEVLGRWL
jgi:hypothetical protein